MKNNLDLETFKYIQKRIEELRRIRLSGKLSLDELGEMVDELNILLDLLDGDGGDKP